MIKIIFSFLIFLPSLALAQAPSNPVVFPTPVEGTIPEIIDNIIDFLLAVAGPIAVLVVVVAGILFMTAGDSKERLKRAKQTLWYAVIGIVVLLLSKGIVLIVINVISGK